MNIDYDKIFVLIVKSISYKALFVIAAVNDLEIEQMNVKTVFLYDDIDDDIWIEQSHLFADNADWICKLIKTLYDLKQTSWIWYNTLTEFLIILNFKFVIFDLEIFINEHIFIAVYVDDLLIVRFDKMKIQSIKNTLSKWFHMTDLRLCCYYLDMKIIRDYLNCTLCLSQCNYIEKILHEFEMQKFKAQTISMNLKIKLVSVSERYICIEND